MTELDLTAAIKALDDHLFAIRWGQGDPVDTEEYVQVVAPLIEKAVREKVAQELEALRKDSDRWPQDAQDGFLDWHHGIESAAAIARGGDEASRG